MIFHFFLQARRTPLVLTFPPSFSTLRGAVRDLLHILPAFRLVETQTVSTVFKSPRNRSTACHPTHRRLLRAKTGQRRQVTDALTSNLTTLRLQRVYRSLRRLGRLSVADHPAVDQLAAILLPSSLSKDWRLARAGKGHSCTNE